MTVTKINATTVRVTDEVSHDYSEKELLRIKAGKEADIVGIQAELDILNSYLDVLK